MIFAYFAIVRPWIGISQVEVGDCYDTNLPAVTVTPYPSLATCITLRNYGSGPAYFVGVETEVAFEPWANAERLCQPAMQHTSENYTVIPQSPWRYTSYSKPSTGSTFIRGVPQQGILGCVGYQSGDAVWHQTPFHVPIRFRNGKGIVFDGKEILSMELKAGPVYVAGRAK